MSFEQNLGLPASGWQTRIKDAAYNSPSGVRIEFQFDGLERSTGKRTTTFEFNQLDGAYVQDNGIGARNYPLACIFIGENHDLEATAFEAALFERGIGSLEHPFYGTFDVIPTGAISRTNNLVEGANISTVSVTFTTTLLEVYPTERTIGLNEVQAILGNFNVTMAQDFADGSGLDDSVVNRVRARTSVLSGLDVISNTLGSIAAATAESQQAFDSAFRAINDGIDILVGQPLLLGQQMLNLALSPADAAAGLTSKFDGYARFIDAMARRAKSATNTTDLAVNDLWLLSGAVGGVQSTTVADYRSRADAINAATTARNISAFTFEAHEDAYRNLDATDLGGGYQQAQEADSANAGRLVDLSNGLLNERIVTTDADRSPIDLCAEFYQDVGDDRLQFFIDSNGLGGDEFFVVPRGRRIKVFVG